MRVAVITSSYPRFQGDGTAPFVQSLSEALQKRGHDICVVAPYDVKVDENHNQSVEVTRFKYIWPKKWHILGHARSLEGDAKLRPMAVILLPLFLCSAFFYLLRITRMQSSQIIHAHWLLPNGLVAAWVAGIRKIPFIVSLHGSDVFVAEKNVLFKAISKYILKRASGVSSCSPELISKAVKLHSDIKIRLIPWGADPRIFKPITNRKTTRKKLGWGEADFVICSLGRMVGKKGFDQLINSFYDVIRSTQRKDLKLVIGGAGPIRAQLLDQIQKLNLDQFVMLPGVVNWDQVPTFLGSADCFVLPSVRNSHGNLDGLPTVLLEAMACSLPCIASNIGGVNLVIQNGQNGILVEPGNVKELKEAINKIIIETGRAKQIGKTARDDVVKRFNWEQVALEFEKMINGISHPHQQVRLGQSYRNSMLPHLVEIPSVERALDLGCHDGRWLENISANLKIGVDIDPIDRHNGIEMVKADITRLPFKSESFSLVSSLDVLEHLEDPVPGSEEIARVMGKTGLMILTTPSEQIRLFPRCLTGFISKSWGHNFRYGYSRKELENLFREKMVTTIKPWQAKAYRLYYLGLRALYQFHKSLSLKLLKRIIKHDLRDPWGDHGYWLVTGYKKEKL